jgi:hypothetical protein
MPVPLSLNKPAIKASVLDGLRDMGRAERRRPLHVCDGPGDLQYPAVGAGGEPLLVLADLLGRAAAGAAPVAEITAGTGMRRPFLNIIICAAYNWENGGSQPETKYMPSIIDYLG